MATHKYCCICLLSSDLARILEEGLITAYTLSIKGDSSLLDKVDEYSISGKQLRVFTELDWEKLNIIKDMKIWLRNSQSRLIIQALVVFLFKLRTGNSNKMIASILQLTDEHVVSDYSNSIIKSFENDVLTLRFGINSVIRDDIIQNRTTEMVKNDSIWMKIYLLFYFSVHNWQLCYWLAWTIFG